eukprot:snap_masked-scaffold_1-processed-gene-3.17-mRNA-1 protein AED:1.00 eAED:1.00 QI:0/0/0/0/1/1/4/0/318
MDENLLLLEKKYKKKISTVHRLNEEKKALIEKRLLETRNFEEQHTLSNDRVHALRKQIAYSRVSLAEVRARNIFLKRKISLLKSKVESLTKKLEIVLLKRKDIRKNFIKQSNNLLQSKAREVTESEIHIDRILEKRENIYWLRDDMDSKKPLKLGLRSVRSELKKSLPNFNLTFGNALPSTNKVNTNSSIRTKKRKFKTGKDVLIHGESKGKRMKKKVQLLCTKYGLNNEVQKKSLIEKITNRKKTKDETVIHKKQRKNKLPTKKQTLKKRGDGNADLHKDSNSVIVDAFDKHFPNLKLIVTPAGTRNLKNRETGWKN